MILWTSPKLQEALPDGPLPAARHPLRIMVESGQWNGSPRVCFDLLFKRLEMPSGTRIRYWLIVYDEPSPNRIRLTIRDYGRRSWFIARLESRPWGIVPCTWGYALERAGAATGRSVYLEVQYAVEES